MRCIGSVVVLVACASLWGAAARADWKTYSPASPECASSCAAGYDRCMNSNQGSWNYRLHECGFGRMKCTQRCGHCDPNWADQTFCNGWPG
jgi:hypothetical protein